MRNPDRIPVVLEALRKLWVTCPDMRLGQLVCSLIGLDPFNVEDEVLVAQAETRLAWVDLRHTQSGN